MKDKTFLFCFMLVLCNLRLAIADTENTPEITVYRNASCSCCGKWLDHIQANQFKVKNVIIDNIAEIKAKLGIPEKLASCHTAVVGNYLIEGHVPASDIKNLLLTKPQVKGIAVPGMPLGSPGMEYNGSPDSYKVLSFDSMGKFEEFANY